MYLYVYVCCRGWAGGAQLCLSNAFAQADELEAKAQALDHGAGGSQLFCSAHVQDLIDSGVYTKDDAAVQCIRTIAPRHFMLPPSQVRGHVPKAKATEEREALMRRRQIAKGGQGRKSF